MILYISIKQTGKRKDCITRKPFKLAAIPATLRELLTEIVRLNVSEYNAKAVEPSILTYLCPEVIEREILSGKVGFHDRKNEQPADLQKAIDTAILAFQDGIYRVWIGENEMVALDEPMAIHDGDGLTLIRFTMLAGRLW